MESNDENTWQQVACDLPGTTRTPYEIGVNELPRLEDRSGSSLNRNGDVTGSNEPRIPQPDGSLAETPKKRRRPTNAPTELRRRSKRTKNTEEDDNRMNSSSPPLATHSVRTTIERQAPRPANTKTRGPNWSPEFLLTEPKSKLVHCNLNELISKHAWDMLTPEDQAECMALLPSLDLIYDNHDTDSHLTPRPRLLAGFFEDNASLQDDIRTFQSDLSDGRFQSSFLQRAAIAREKRLRGDFDKWKDDQFELWWGQNQRLASGMLAGDTTKLKLIDMAKNGMLREGDVWRYSRTFYGVVTVKKELICTKVDGESFTLTFACPPETAEYIRSGLQPIIIDRVENPSALESRLLDEDGRITRSNRPHGNAFKSMRVIRGSEDIGSLFDVRMSAFDKLHGGIA